MHRDPATKTKRNARRVTLLLSVGVALTAPALTAPALAAAHGTVAASTTEDIAIARKAKRAAPPSWEPLGPACFSRAEREHKLVLLYGQAKWCHWCHVIEETTYRDERLRVLLDEHFILTRVDIDARPDLAERYSEWGWPATVVLDPGGNELVKLRGFVDAQALARELATLLEARTDAAAKKGAAAKNAAANDGKQGESASTETPHSTLSHSEIQTRLDALYDETLGGWGRRQKLPIAANVLVELRRAAKGNPLSAERARQTLIAQRALIDPVWGGLSQYSVPNTWNKPHFEKLFLQQAQNIEAYARAASLDPTFASDAERITRYVLGHLTAKDGLFFVSQDADLINDRQFVDGHHYWRLSDRERRALGEPRIDTHRYALQAGAGLAALVALVEIPELPDAARSEYRAHLARATRAALAEWPTPLPSRGPNSFLVDAAALCRGLAAVARIDGMWSAASARDDASTTVVRLAQLMWERFGASAPLRDAAELGDGLAEPTASFTANVSAARCLLAAALVDDPQRATLKGRAASLIEWASDRRRVEAEGRMLGELLLAHEELSR